MPLRRVSICCRCATRASPRSTPLLSRLRSRSGARARCGRVCSFVGRSALLLILHAPAFIERNAEFFAAASSGARAAPDGDEDLVSFELQFLVALRGGGDCSPVLDFHRADLGFEMEFH